MGKLSEKLLRQEGLQIAACGRVADAWEHRVGKQRELRKEALKGSRQNQKPKNRANDEAKKTHGSWRRHCQCNRLHQLAKPAICPFPRTSSCFTLKSLSSPNPLWNQRVRVDDRITRSVEMV